ncbi:hypothetical protein SRB17_82010 [Streptomyces sp. RB17]|nr:hypothetical protein [Streptomyces sp. RB17]
MWAVYRLHPGPDAQGQREETVQGTYVPAAVRDEQLARITHLVRSLSGAPRLYGMCAQVDPGEIALRMIEGIEPAEPAPVARREVNAYREQASRVQAALAGGIAFRPAHPAEIVWLIQHTLHRGLAEPLLTEAETSELYGGQIAGGVLRSPSYADLDQVRLHEGGTDPELDDIEAAAVGDRLVRAGAFDRGRHQHDQVTRCGLRNVACGQGWGRSSGRVVRRR